MKKLSVLFLMTCFLLILLPTATFYAVPASPVPFPALQPDGSTIMVLLRGDEFLNWAEDMDGNLIIYDIDQNGYCYANWTGELPESTGELIIDTQTKTFGVHTSQRRENSVNIPETTIKAANEQRERLRHVTSQVSSRSRISYNFESQLLDQPAVADISELRRKVLVIIVRWEDESNLYGLEPLTGQQIHDLMFNPLTNSVNAYFMELLGKTEDIVIPAQALNPFDGNQGILEVFIPGSHTDPRLDFGKMDRIVNAAYDAVGPYINFADYDVNGDGYVSSDELTVCVIVHGYEAAYGAPGPSVWGSAGYTGGMRDGVWTPSTFIQGAYHYDHPLTIGILCHEFGHSGYHFDDTYDYGYLYDGVSSQGMGHWSLMAGGGWASKNGEYLGETPSYVDAYNLVEYCLISPGIISGREENIKSVSQTDIFIVISPYNDRQYFLTQLRKYGETNNYDRGIFEQMGVYSDTSVGGLLIYHIDEDVWSMNNKNTHYRAGIEEAHGVQQHLSILWGTSGSLNDLWGTDYILFSQTTDPSSGLYSPFTWDKTPPTQDQESGVTIHGITWDSAAQSTTFGVRESMFYSEAFPDPNFRAIALSLIGGGRNDSSLFTGDDRAFFAAIAQLDTANKNIADLTGIEHFSGLNQLYCQGNRLIKLDLTKNNMLSAVNCSGNWLRSVLLPENPLLSLDCSDNFLVSPNSIFRYKNVLDFTFGIQKDPALMTYAVAFPDRIFRSIAVGLIGDARGDDEIVRAGDKDFWASYGSHEYGYLYLTNRGISEMAGIEFFTGLKQLDCGTSSLKVLDISKNTALTIVTCYNNMLEALDVSQNTDLVTLWCFNNQISILDVSLNTALVQLDCMNNYFTKLDISQNVFLVELDCRGNQLTELDITNNTALTFLNCGGNQLTELDVSNNHALKNLYCWGNQLTELDTSKNSDLEVLSCFDNQLTVLETSKNSQLIVLFCYNNQLTGLNVLQNTSLELLFCHNNHMLSPDDVIGWREIGLILGETFSYYPQRGANITAKFIDPVFLAAVREIVGKGYGEPIFERDVYDISYLNVGDRGITSLAGIEYFVNLQYLYCYYNQLSVLDVSNNPLLQRLICHDNRLTALDISNNPSLNELYCHNNYFSSPNDIIGWEIIFHAPGQAHVNYGSNDFSFYPIRTESNVFGLCGDSLTWNIDIITGILEITGMGDMWDFDYWAQPWLDYRYKINAVAVSDGVASIGSYAFAGFHDLISITISEGVTSIGNYAFGWCYNIVRITIPSSVDTIGEWAFFNCVQLYYIHFVSATPPVFVDENAFAGGRVNALAIVPDIVTGYGAEGSFWYGLTVTYESNLPSQLLPPVNLRWSSDMPGMAIWENAEFDNHTNGYFCVELFRDGVNVYSASFFNTTEREILWYFSNQIDVTGEYTFRVRMFDWNIPGIESEWAYSPGFTYVRPVQLPAPDGLEWIDSVWASWSSVDGPVSYYEWQLISDDESIVCSTTTSFTTVNIVGGLEYAEDGIYTFRVRAISYNILEAAHSEWSAGSIIDTWLIPRTALIRWGYTISCNVGDELWGWFNICLWRDSLVNLDYGQDISDWFTNLPLGLSASVTWLSWTERSVDIEISGIPTELSLEQVAITIPAKYLSSGMALNVVENPTVKFDIRKSQAVNLTGSAIISNMAPRIGDVLNGSLENGNNTGTLSYIWKADEIQVGSGISYTVTVDEYNKAITLEITSSVETGTITSNPTSDVLKKAGPSAPYAPTVAGKSHNSVTLASNAAYEFKMDNGEWQVSSTFDGLSPDTVYTFYQRIKETADTEASDSSSGLDVTTNELTGGYTITVGDEEAGGAGIQRKITIDFAEGLNIDGKHIVARVKKGEGEETTVIVMTISAKQNALISYAMIGAVVDVWLTDGMPNLIGAELGVKIFATASGK